MRSVRSNVFTVNAIPAPAVKTPVCSSEKARFPWPVTVSSVRTCERPVPEAGGGGRPTAAGFPLPGGVGWNADARGPAGGGDRGGVGSTAGRRGGMRSGEGFTGGGVVVAVSLTVGGRAGVLGTGSRHGPGE